jgi:hypothetical protein
MSSSKGPYKKLWEQLQAIVTYSPKKRYSREELLQLLNYMEKGDPKND